MTRSPAYRLPASVLMAAILPAMLAVAGLSLPVLGGIFAAGVVALYPIL